MPGSLIQRALGLVPPWEVANIAFDAERHRLDIQLSFERGARFACPGGDSDDCPVHDLTVKEWRHLNVLEHEAYLHAKVPQVRCAKHGVRLIQVPWARPGSGFTLLFEALAMVLMREMPVRAAARIVGAHDMRSWRVLMHHVDTARRQEDFSGVEQAGVDETSHRRGHDFVSVFADLDRAKVIFATSTRETKVIGEFKTDLEAHGGKAANVYRFSADFWRPYRTGIKEQFPNATLTVDRYHMVQLLNRAVDEVRRREQRTAPGLKNSRYTWLKKHRYDVLRWFRTHISIGVLEAINGLVQAAKRRARGYRTDRYYIAMIYMTAGKIPDVPALLYALRRRLRKSMVRLIASSLFAGSSTNVCRPPS